MRKVVTPENLSKDFTVNLAAAKPVGLNLNTVQFTRDGTTGLISIAIAGFTPFLFDDTGAVDGSILQYDLDDGIWRATNNLAAAAVVASIDTYLAQTDWRVPATFVFKTANYILQAADFKREKIIAMNVATDANTLTVPPDLVVIERATGLQYGTGLTTIVAGAGVTLHGAQGALKAHFQYSSFQIIPTGIADTYVVIGDLVA